MGHTRYETKCRKCGKIHMHNMAIMAESRNQEWQRQKEFMNLIDFISAHSNKSLLLPCECIDRGSSVHDIVGMIIDNDEEETENIE